MCKLKRRTSEFAAKKSYAKNREIETPAGANNAFGALPKPTWWAAAAMMPRQSISFASSKWWFGEPIVLVLQCKSFRFARQKYKFRIAAITPFWYWRCKFRIMNELRKSPIFVVYATKCFVFANSRILIWRFAAFFAFCLTHPAEMPACCQASPKEYFYLPPHVVLGYIVDT